MPRKKQKLFLLTLVILTFLAVQFLENSPKANQNSLLPKSELFTGMADVNSFMVGYDRWAKDYKENGGDKYLSLPLTPVKGISMDNVDALGAVTFNLENGEISIQVEGLGTSGWDAWMVRSAETGKKTIKPSPEDQLLFLGNLTKENKPSKEKRSSLTTYLTPNEILDFAMDMLVVTPANQDLSKGFALWAMPTLYQKLYLSGLQGRFGNIGNNGGTKGIEAIEEMISKGRTLFISETFEGNGRTCASCHKEEGNFSIDQAMIATLPTTDPLFVAETIPALNKNFENPTLLRNNALFIENVDGTDDLEKKFTLRSSSHTLALSTSIKAPPVQNGINIVDFTTVPPLQRLGWSGDGAPGNGTLREFALGAIAQHFTKTLARKEGPDFRLANSQELDALEAFQLSLGRQEDFDLKVLSVKSPMVEKGRKIYIDDTVGKCNLCHFNAGAACGFCFTMNRLSADINGTFETGVDKVPGLPTLPPDGGFGIVPRPDGSFGDIRTAQFSTPTLVEAADTLPLFHNNAFKTLEESVEFYSSKAFNQSFNGKNFPLPPLKGGIKLTKKQNNSISALLRVLNTLENVRSSIALIKRAQNSDDPTSLQLLIQFAANEQSDAIKVMKEGVAPKITNATTIVQNLTEAQNKVKAAGLLTDKTARNTMLESATTQLKVARDLLVDPNTLPPSFKQ